MNNLRSDRSMSIGSASIFALVIVLPSMALLIILYSAVWGYENFFEGLERFFKWDSFLPALLLGVPMHEGIHGLTWLWMGKIPKEKIKFGVKHLTPYTHCEVPMASRAYRIGAIMPATVQGLLPYAMGLISGSGWLTILGLTFTFAAAGDLLILWILRGVRADAMVVDHPSRVGCYVFE